MPNIEFKPSQSAHKKVWWDMLSGFKGAAEKSVIA